MGVEIERKFLVCNDSWRAGASGTAYRQGYLCHRADSTVRVRTDGQHAVLTVKGETVGCMRAEFEYPLPAQDVDALLALCRQPLIEKVRYRVEHDGLVWEIDEFAGENTGLVLAELELQRPDQRFALPAWAGREVTYEPRYYNVSLQQYPYSRWTAAERE